MEPGINQLVNRCFDFSQKGKFEDIKGVIRSSKSEDGQQ
jgi:hypothetical protein